MSARKSFSWPIVGAIAASGTFVCLLCVFFEPRWETNDDVAISMAAHGYGIAARGTPSVFLSNIVWGLLVRSIPTIRGVLGYSIATLGVLVAVGAAVFYALCRHGVHVIAAFLVLALILLRPVLFPQFTVNAGLLLIGAIACWHVFARDNSRGSLWLGCLLAFLGWAVRSREFFLVLLVAVPLLPWRALLGRTAARVAVLSLIVAMGAASAADAIAFRAPEWKAFLDLQPVRVQYTDFGAGQQLERRPDILGRHGYSTNDVGLITDWFFADPKVADPAKLRAMLDELGPIALTVGSQENAWAAASALVARGLVPLFMLGLALVIIRPRWQLVISWALTIAAVVVIGLLGRPAILRVYVPLETLLVVAPFLLTPFAGWRRYVSTMAVVAACLLNVRVFIPESRRVHAISEQARRDFAAFPHETVVVWGADFPFEAVYPVLGPSPAAMQFRLYGLGGFTLAPFGVAYSEAKAGRSLVARLTSSDGVPILSHEFDSLATYCREHFHGQLVELSAQPYGSVVVSRRRCQALP